LHYLGAPSTSPCPKVQNSLKYLPSLKKLKWQKSLQLSQLLLMHPTPRFKIGSNVFQALKKKLKWQNSLLLSQLLLMDCFKESNL
jgi:hypothetical protein